MQMTTRQFDCPAVRVTWPTSILASFFSFFFFSFSFFLSLSSPRKWVKSQDNGVKCRINFNADFFFFSLCFPQPVSYLVQKMKSNPLCCLCEFPFVFRAVNTYSMLWSQRHSVTWQCSFFDWLCVRAQPPLLFTSVLGNWPEMIWVAD